MAYFSSCFDALYCQYAARVPQVVDLLLKLYKFLNFSVSKALLHGIIMPVTAAPGGVVARQAIDVPTGGLGGMSLPAEYHLSLKKC